MENQSPSKSSIFSCFIGKFVKIVYYDGAAVSIMKGILQRVDSFFVYVKGDYSQKIISLQKISSIEPLKNGN
jgi:hypothetical protein